MTDYTERIGAAGAPTFGALFGAPHEDQIMRGYTETAPLADGWRQRVPLHQLHPLLVHACLFGASYAPQVNAAARAALAA